MSDRSEIGKKQERREGVGSGRRMASCQGRGGTIKTGEENSGLKKKRLRGWKGCDKRLGKHEGYLKEKR